MAVIVQTGGPPARQPEFDRGVFRDRPIPVLSRGTHGRYPGSVEQQAERVAQASSLWVARTGGLGRTAIRQDARVAGVNSGGVGLVSTGARWRHSRRRASLGVRSAALQDHSDIAEPASYERLLRYPVEPAAIPSPLALRRSRFEGADARCRRSAGSSVDGGGVELGQADALEESQAISISSCTGSAYPRDSRWMGPAPPLSSSRSRSRRSIASWLI